MSNRKSSHKMTNVIKEKMTKVDKCEKRGDDVLVAEELEGSREDGLDDLDVEASEPAGNTFLPATQDFSAKSKVRVTKT